MNAHHLDYILTSVLKWTGERKAATTEYYAHGTSRAELQRKYSPGFKFTVHRDVETVQSIYNQAFCIINAELL